MNRPIDTAHAPFLFFDEAPTFGHSGGIIGVTLTARRIVRGETDGTVVADDVVVAHLRCNLVAAQMLRDALNSALLLATPTKADVN